MSDNNTETTTDLTATPDNDFEAALSEIKTTETADAGIDARVAELVEQESKLEQPSEAIPEPKPLDEPKKYETYVQEVVKIKKKLLDEKRRAKEEAQKLTQLAQQGQRFEELMNLRQTNPYEFIKQVQLEPDAVVQAMLQDAEAQVELTPQELQQQTLQKVQEEIDKRIELEREKARIEAENRHKELYIQESINNYQNQIQKVCLENQDKYELINTFGAHKRVWNEVVKFYEKYNEVPTPEVAAEVVEETIRKELEKLKNTKLFQSLAGKAPANNSNREQATSLTLTNQIAKASSELYSDDLDDDAAFKEALKLIRVNE